MKNEFKEPGPAWNEADRLAALARYNILDTPSETQFGDIVTIAAQICGVPMALISLVDDRRQWFKAAVGLAAKETPRSVAFCAHAIQREGIFVVGDATKDERFATNPLVTDDPNLRFYAGAPLLTPDGFPLGTLCVLDNKPRELTREQLSTLDALSRQVMLQLELRLVLAEKSIAEKRHRMILESAIEYAIISMDHDGVISSWNEGAFRIFGWTHEEMKGRNYAAFFATEDHTEDAVRNEMAKSLAQGRAGEDRWHRRKDGTKFWASGQLMPLTDEDDRPIGFIKILRDRTEYRHAEESLQLLNATLEQRVMTEVAERMRAEDDLRQAQKMDALGQLTGGIAHDFNNLLTGIIGSLDIVRRRMNARRLDDIPRFMDAASTSAQRAAALTHRLLAFARRQPLDTQPNDINKLVAGLEELLHRTIGEQTTLQTVLSTDLWPASTDANQFENALLNLAINARDAMPNGGLLTIETSNTRLDAKYAAAQDVLAGDYVLVSVADTGGGMPPDVVKRAFDPFFTTKPIGQGTGLGLSMIYGFAKQSSGHLRIDSEVGKGTTVKLYLARALTGVLEHVPEGGASPHGGGETILVVEDDATVRLLITDVLEELGYAHAEAADARTAVVILQSNQRIDLLVTDVGLPNMDGRQLAEIARQTRPELKVLFVTGYAENATSRGGFLDAGMDMLTKPFTLDALGNKIRDVLGR